MNAGQTMQYIPGEKGVAYFLIDAFLIDMDRNEQEIFISYKSRIS